MSNCYPHHFLLRALTMNSDHCPSQHSYYHKHLNYTHVIERDLRQGNSGQLSICLGLPSALSETLSSGFQRYTEFKDFFNFCHPSYMFSAASVQTASWYTERQSPLQHLDTTYPEKGSAVKHNVIQHSEVAQATGMLMLIMDLQNVELNIYIASKILAVSMLYLKHCDWRPSWRWRHPNGKNLALL